MTLRKRQVYEMTTTSKFTLSEIDDLLRQLKDDSRREGMSKDEVVVVQDELMNLNAANGKLKRVSNGFRLGFIGAIFLGIFLLATMLGLAYTVAVKAAMMSIQRDGTLWAGHSKHIVATDSAATIFRLNNNVTSWTSSENIFHKDFVQCLPESTATEIFNHVYAGRNVILEMKEKRDSKVHDISLHLSPDGMSWDPSSKTVCYKIPYTESLQRVKLCFFPTFKCTSSSPADQGPSVGIGFSD